MGGNQRTIVDGQSRGVRLLLRYEGTVKKVARVGWSKRDASVYVMLYATERQHRYAGTVAVSAQAPLPLDLRASARLHGPDGDVKLSIHESGDCHVDLGGRRSRSVAGTPLTSAHQGHICTIVAPEPSSLPTLDQRHGRVRTTDLIADSAEFAWNGAQIFLFAFLDRDDTGGQDFPAGFALRRGDNREPLWIALWFHGFKSDGLGDPGLFALAGMRRDSAHRRRLEDRIYGLVTESVPTAVEPPADAMRRARTWMERGWGTRSQ